MIWLAKGSQWLVSPLDTTPDALPRHRGAGLKVIRLTVETSDEDEGRPNDIIVGSLD